MTYASGEVSGRQPQEAPVALVTGSMSEIGAAVARRLAAEGMRVVMNGEPAAGPPGALYVAADIAVREEAEALVAATVLRYGRLDVLVNSAGAPGSVPRQDAAAADAEVWREFFDVDVIGTWQMCLAAMPLLRASGAGRVVNVWSVADVRPAGSAVPCSVSNMAMTNLTRLLAAVTGPEVRVDVVAPGLTDMAGAETCEEVAKAVLAVIRRPPDDGRRGTPVLTAPRAARVRSAGAAP